MGLLTGSHPSESRGMPGCLFFPSTQGKKLATTLIFYVKELMSLFNYVTRIVTLMVPSERGREVRAWSSEEPMSTIICISSLESYRGWVSRGESLASLF